jgi:hypothetical protein
MFGDWFNRSNDNVDGQPFYFRRDIPANLFAAALAGSCHILLCGPARQGKTTLVQNELGDRKRVTFQTTPDSTFSDIFRTYFLALGASVTVESKRRKKFGAKAEISWKWPLISAGGGVDTSGESETTQRNFTADISNPNDVCQLLHEIGLTPLLVIEHFERLQRKERRKFLEFLNVSAEVKALRVLLVASVVDTPLDWRERVQLAKSLAIVVLPSQLREEERRACITGYLHALKCPSSPESISLIEASVDGALETTLAGCEIAVPLILGNTPTDALKEAINAGLCGRSQSQFMALVSVIIEADFTFKAARPVAHTYDEYRRALQEPEIDDALAQDSVFVSLQRALAGPCDIDVADEALQSIATGAADLGREIIANQTSAEAVRLVAFALTTLLKAPYDGVTERYVSAFDTEQIEINFGVSICEMLANSSLDAELALSAETLAAHVGPTGYQVLPRRDGSPVVRFARRLQRLQRKLGIDPPIFRIRGDSIVLWSAAHARAFGDLRTQLRELADGFVDEAKI